MFCNATDIDLISIVEDNGFRLVETRITFITLIEKQNSIQYTSGEENISFATNDDLEGILSLTHKSFLNNPSFFSRYKNRSFFSYQETKRYYSAWIENHMYDDNTLFAVLKIGGNVIGYYIYKCIGKYNSKRFYKAILAAVDPGHRGRQYHLVMQSFLFKHISDETFYLDNTTQLTNFPTITNHMNSKKRIERIEFIFFKKLIN